MRYDWLDSEELEVNDRFDKGEYLEKTIEKKERNQKRERERFGSDRDAEAELLALYLEELKAVPPVEELMKKELMQAASDGKQEARKRLAEIYLMQAVQLAAAYRGRGVGLADLIQEANVGLMEAMLEKEITEQSILDSIEEALRRALAEEGRVVQAGEQMAERLNRLSDAAKELAERYGTEPSAEELAEYLHLTVEEVESGMKISLDVLCVENE